MFYKILTVAALATFEIYAAIPAGFAFGLPAVTIFIASTIGGLFGVFVAAFLGDKIRAFVQRKWPSKKEKKVSPLALKLWNKYGIVGLGVLGTMTIGAPISIAVGVGLNAEIKKLVIWCCVGVVARCIIFTFIAHHATNAITNA